MFLLGPRLFLFSLILYFSHTVSKEARFARRLGIPACRKTKMAVKPEAEPSVGRVSGPHRPGVSRISGKPSSRGSLTTSRNAESPMFPFPMSSCRSRLQPSFPADSSRPRLNKTNKHFGYKTVINGEKL